MNSGTTVGGSSVKPVNSIRTAARPGSRRLLLLLFLIASNGKQSGEAFPAINSPEAFISAVALCSYRGASLGNAELVLAADVQDIWSGLSGTEPSSHGERGAAPSRGGLWTWDESRLCLAALLTQQPTAAGAAGAAVGDAATPAPVLVSLEGRPCTQRLSYACVPDADVRAAGLTPSSEWFRAYVRNGSTAGAAAGATAATAALVVGSSSPHLLGPERSGLVLLRSGFALGGTRVPLGLKAEEWGPQLMNNSMQGAFGTEPYYSIEAPAQLHTLAFDDSDRFWSRGPVVSAFTRSYNGRLLALRPVREAEVDAAISTDTAAAAAGNTSSDSNSLLREGVFGASRPDLDGISSAPYETHHVGSYNDYVVTVQGCFRTLAVEVLLLVTRSGRRYRLGRGSCTVWFREDAPPGGYLAGFAGLQLDVGYWSSQPPMRWAEGQVPNAPWLMQLELVWAAPAGSQPPAYTQRLPALLRHSTAQIAPPSSACPGAYPLASLDHQQMHYCTWPWRELPTPYTWEPITGVGCPSNMCCGTPVYALGVYVPFNYFLPICSADVTGCIRRCQVQAGLCGVVPDRPVLHFAVSSSAAAGSNTATTPGVAAAPVSAPVPPQQSYIVYPGTHVPYDAAAEMCRTSNYMGLAWRLVAAREVLTWTTALDLRNPAYGALVELGYFWLGGVAGATDSSGGSACATAVYGSAGVGDSDGSATPDYDRVTYDSSVPCDGVGAVVCALAAAPADPAGGGGSNSSSSSSSSVLVPPGRGGGRVWSPGPHRLTASRRIASGNYGNISCSAMLLETANSSTSSQQQQQQPAALNASSTTVVLAAAPRAFLVSTAVQVSEMGNSVSAVSALGVELGGGGSAATAANMTAGNPSTRGWHRLELQPGEGVVALSGCAGGHLEVLLLHTSSGRVLMPPLTAGPEDAATGSAACSSSFVETAPAGAYLVGLQVTFGQFIESLRLIWGQPLAALSGGSSSNGGSGTSGSNAGSSEGTEGRGDGVLDSSVAVGGGLGAAAPSSAGPHGEQQPAAVDGVGNNPSSGSSSTPQSGSSGGGGGPVTAAAIGGAVVGGVALALAVTAAVVLRRRYARRQAKQSTEGKLHSDGSVGPAATGTPKGGGGGGGYSDPAGAASPLSSDGCAMASGSASSIANNSASGSTLNAHVSSAISLAAVPSAAEAAQAVASARQPVSGVCGDRRAAYVTLLVEGGEGGSGAAAARGLVSDVLAAARSCVSPGMCRPAQLQGQHVAGAASEAATGTAVRQAAPAASPVGPTEPGADAAAATRVTRILSLRASESEHHVPQPQQQPSSQRQQLHAAGTAPRNAGVPGRDVRCHSGGGSVAASPSSCRPAESPLPRLWATLSWAVSPTIQLMGTTESEGLPSSKRWGQMPMSGRWEQLPRISSLERLPSASQSPCCAVPVEATPGEGDAAPAPLPAPQGPQGLPAMAEELDFHKRMYAYVSSCHVLASGAGKCSSVVGDAGAPVGAAQQQDAEGGGALGAQPAQESPVAAGAALGDAGNGGPQGIEQSLVHAQAQLAGRAQEQQGEQQGQRRDLVLTSVLGSGSFGVVFNGTWRGLRVAVKTLVVHDSLLGTEARRRHRAVLEAAISKSLNHPNVVATYETEVIPLSVHGTARNLSAHPDPLAAGGGPAGVASEAAVLDATTDTYKLLLVMEYCDAGSLTRALEMDAVGSVAAGGAAGLCALTLALDVACGMRHIHARSIVHGDLSAGNILLCSTADAQCRGGRDLADAPLRSPLAGLWAPPLVAKVADFGLSVHMGEHQTHASNKFQGTPAYTAPEVLSRGRLSAAADVWSFGCILLELTHGERISRIRARAATAAAAAPAPAAAGPADLHGTGGKPVWVPWTAPPPGSSPRLAQLLAACLAMEPSARPSFDQVAEALVAILVESHRNAQHNVMTTMRVSSTPQPQNPVSESAGQ